MRCPGPPAPLRRQHGGGPPLRRLLPALLAAAAAGQGPDRLGGRPPPGLLWEAAAREGAEPQDSSRDPAAVCMLQRPATARRWGPAAAAVPAAALPAAAQGPALAGGGNSTPRPGIGSSRSLPPEPARLRLGAAGPLEAGPPEAGLPEAAAPDPRGADIWNSSVAWSTVRSYHPAGVISHIGGGRVAWHNASFLSLNAIYVLAAVAYPAFLLLALLVASVLLGLCLKGPEGAEEPPARSSWEDPLCRPPTADAEAFTGLSLGAYACWAALCGAIPALLVFGTPVLLVAMSYQHPQEVFAVLAILSSCFIFHGGLHMLVFAGAGVARMRRALASPGADWEGGDAATHWVLLPQYREDVEVVSAALASVARSRVARQRICVLLAMEGSEPEARWKAEELQRRFAGQFLELRATFHPAGLPNHPPGKASNVSWAFEVLRLGLAAAPGAAREEATGGEAWAGGTDLDGTIVTVCDADSEFHPRYFEAVSAMFAGAGEADRHSRIWQAPMLHLKNYHSVPGLVAVGALFTSMAELASLSDPNAVRLPYSTYSLSLTLARRVGGWDPEWIAEDYHMGLKCLLLSRAAISVEPVLLPTVSYMVEEETWLGTLWARWVQAQRHALGFSDVTYFFRTLPLVLSHAASQEPGHESMSRFWALVSQGLGVLIKLTNIHALVGVLSTYGAIQSAMRTVMRLAFEEDRHLVFLFDSASFCTVLLAIAGLLFTAALSALFVCLYALVRDRLEGAAARHPLWHFCRVAALVFACGPVYFLALALCTWRAAALVLLRQPLEYQVAPKPPPLAAAAAPERAAGPERCGR